MANSSPSPQPCRTVNDYDGEAALRMALMQLDLSSTNERDEAPPEESREDDLSDVNLRDEWDWVLHKGDKKTSIPQTVTEEVQRLQALKKYMILDSDREATFDRLTSMAGRVFDVPIALVSLVDIGRQWFMSNFGLGEVRQTPRKLAFCAHAIQGKTSVFTVPDATKDSRFCDSPLVLGPPNIRFYAGAPLISRDGYKLGTFCIIDSKPWPNGMTEKEKAILLDFATMTVQAMEDRRKLLQKGDNNEPARLVAAGAYDQLAPILGLRSSIDALVTDPTVAERLDQNQNKHLALASKNIDLLDRICQTTVKSLQETNKSAMGCSFQIPLLVNKYKSSPFVNLNEVFQTIEMLAESIPKKVPLHLSLDNNTPQTVIMDDLKIIRCSLNLLSQAFALTESGFVRFAIFAKSDRLCFECEYTGNNLSPNEENNLFCSDAESECFPGDHDDSTGAIELRIFSLASQIESIGGKYGFRQRRKTESDGVLDNTTSVSGSISWFSVPLALPKQASGAKSIPVNTTIHPNPPKLPNQGQRQFATNCARRRKKGSTLSYVSKAARNAKDIERIDNFSTKAVESSKAEPLSTISEETMESRKKKALVIEDSAIVRKCLTRGFTKLGFEVSEAGDGMEGLDALKKNSFDISLCDFIMPKSDGIECVKQYREWERKGSHGIPSKQQYIVGISAHASTGDVEKGMAAGMDAFIKKPITIKVLRELVENLDKGQSALNEGSGSRAGNKRIGACETGDDSKTEEIRTVTKRQKLVDKGLASG